MKTRKKGDNFEFHIQKEISELIADLGLRCRFRRVGMSGSLEGKKGDFEWSFHFRKLQGEAKKGKQVPLTLYNWLEKDDSDFLIIASDRKPTLFVTPLENLEHFLTCQETYGPKEPDERQIQLPLQSQY